MENTAECGDGGWTLAMKIDGSKVSDIFAPDSLNSAVTKPH